MNNKHTFSVGQKVRYKGDSKLFGKVVDTSCQEDDLVMVEREDNSTTECDVYEIELHDPEADKARAVRAQAFVNEAVRSLEASFEAWKSAIKEYGGDSNEDAYLMMQDDLVDLTKFEDVLENGWRTSSFYC